MFNISLAKKIKPLICLGILIAWAIFSSCGLLKPKSAEKKTDATFGGKIPSSWNGAEDWSESSWEVVEP